MRQGTRGTASAIAGLAGCALASSIVLASPPASPDPVVTTGVPAAAPSAASAGRSPDLVPELDAAVRAIASERALGGAAVGIAIVDVDSGHVLAAVNEHTAMNPASNAKLYTAAAALATLHGDHRYETTLSGRVEGGAVAGPLVLRGYGDPSLSTGDLWELVSGLKEFGVARVDGDILVDQEFYDDQTTPPAFEQQPNEWASFRAPVSAVALDENCITMTVRPSSPGNPAHVAFEPPGFVDVEGSVRTAAPGGADTVELTLSANGERMKASVSGAVSGDSRLVRFTRRAEDPRLLSGYALAALLERADVKFGGSVKLGTRPAGHLIAKHASAPLSSLLYSLGKQSDNFYAEMIFKSLGGEGHARPARTTDSGEIVARFLERIGASDPGVVMKNGSGLFDADRVSAYGTTQLLRWAWRDPAIQPEYVAQLSVSGVDGTLRKRFRTDSMRRRVRAKTGTLDDVIALSGYVLRQDGHAPIAFSIFFNHVMGKQDAARHAADRLVDLIAHWADRH
jgi:D-alanyl-D-alanine carboxypeptidase/D-alanyl-D-alanine-endopeptidase (penicillin-binding protein 4)